MAPEGAAALTDSGAVIRSIKQEFTKGFSLGSYLACRTSAGDELWRQDVAASSRYDNPGLILDDQVAQPDLDSQ